MLWASVDFQTFHTIFGQLVLWQHALDRVFNDALWELLANILERCIFDAARETRVAVINLAGLFVARNDGVLRVDNDNVVAAVNVRSVGWLVFANQVFCDLSRYAAKRCARSVDQDPAA